MASALIASPVVAEENSLIGGTWLHSETVDDAYHPGQKIMTSFAVQYTPNGMAYAQYSQAGSTGSSQISAAFKVQFTGANSYTDYFQSCEDGLWNHAGCQMMFNLQTNAPRECQFTFLSPIMVDVSCGGGAPVRYTRH